MPLPQSSSSFGLEIAFLVVSDSLSSLRAFPTMSFSTEPARTKYKKSTEATGVSSIRFHQLCDTPRTGVYLLLNLRPALQDTHLMRPIFVFFLIHKEETEFTLLFYGRLSNTTSQFYVPPSSRSSRKIFSHVFNSVIG